MEQATVKYFTEAQIAILLGTPRAALRARRQRNNEAGRMAYGPPYEFHGADVVYPVAAFRRWCAEVPVEGGATRSNTPALPPCPLGDPLATASPDTEDQIIAELQALQAA